MLYQSLTHTHTLVLLFFPMLHTYDGALASILYIQVLWYFDCELSLVLISQTPLPILSNLVTHRPLSTWHSLCAQDTTALAFRLGVYT